MRSLSGAKLRPFLSRYIFVGLCLLACSVLSSCNKAPDTKAKQASIDANSAVSTLMTIIDKIAPDRVGLNLTSGPMLRGNWEMVCSWHPPDLTPEEMRRQYSRVHKVLQFKEAIYVGTGGSDAGLGAGRVWKLDDGQCKDITPWGDFADRVFSMYVDHDQLYASACRFAGDGQIWKYDGKTWQEVLAFGDSVPCVLDIVRFKGTLCMGTLTTAKHAALTCQVDGEWKEQWEAPTAEIYRFEVFQDQLYVGLAYPAELWRTPDLKTWVRVDNPPNFDPSVSHVETMTVFDSHLIIGFGRDGSKAPLSPTVMAFDGNAWSLVGRQPAEWLTSHNFNASTVFRSTLIVSMGSMFDRMSVWALGKNGEWYPIGSRARGDWGGTSFAQRPFTGEWIYDLEPIGGDLYVTFNGDPGMPALWRFRPLHKHQIARLYHHSDR